jgi:hypothetical protein
MTLTPCLDASVRANHKSDGTFDWGKSIELPAPAVGGAVHSAGLTVRNDEEIRVASRGCGPRNRSDEIWMSRIVRTKDTFNHNLWHATRSDSLYPIESIGRYATARASSTTMATISVRCVKKWGGGLAWIPCG